MIRAILFDMGGTLDGDGVHWLDRFERAYAEAGVTVSRNALRAGFDDAERRMAVDEAIGTTDLQTMLAQHVAWQFDYLGCVDQERQSEIVARCLASIRATVHTHRALLA